MNQNNQDSQNNLIEICKDFKSHINQTIYKYLLVLMKYIFLGKENFQDKEKIKNIIENLRKFTEKINRKIILKRENFIKIEPLEEAYTFENFMNIINFVKKQNLMFAGNIIEGILIKIFSYAIKTSTEDEFGKYIYINFNKLKEPSKSDLPNWFQNAENLFQPEELKNIKDLLTSDSIVKDKEDDGSKKSILFKILLEINKAKLNFLESNTRNSESTRYINNGVLDVIKSELRAYIHLRRHKTNLSGPDGDFIVNSIGNIYYWNFIQSKPAFRLINSFLISVYVYDQNRNSPYIKFAKLKKKEENKDLKKEKEKEKDKEKETDFVDVPFRYELKGASVEGIFSNNIISPVAIEPRISKINFFQNNIREPGLYEFGKIFSFNKQIESLNIKRSLIRGYYLDFFNTGFGIFDNHNLEYLNLSFCYLYNNIDSSLPKLFKHLKGLKTLNLTGNEIKDGVKSLFVLLKKLYRKGKTKLKNLYLNYCALSDSSFYELAELLKSPYCELKCLGLGGNPKSEIINFLKKIKSNKSLEELILYKSNFNNNDIDDICRIISNTNIKALNLYKNEFHNFEKFLNILFRTKIVKGKNKDIDTTLIKLDTCLMNLDLSYNLFNAINKKYIILINELIQENCTTSCLDFSHIIYGLYPDKFKKNQEFQKVVENSKAILSNRKEYYDNLYKKWRENLINIDRYEKENEKEKLKDLSPEIIDYIKNDILTSELAIHPAYLMEQCKYIVKQIIFDKEKDYEKLIREENLKNPTNKGEDEENEHFIEKLRNYIIYERSKENNIKINQELEFKNLIII